MTIEEGEERRDSGETAMGDRGGEGKERGEIRRIRGREKEQGG